VTCANDNGTAACTDIDECATNNGGCGNEALFSCTNQYAAAATCAPIAGSCTVSSDCSGSDTECATRTCTNNVCGVSYATFGTLTSSQTLGNCKRNVCDGAGAVVSDTDANDVPSSDGSDCTLEECVGNVPTHTPLALNTACDQYGGSFCSSTGTCVACNSVSQCPGTDTECAKRTCQANACFLAYTEAGTPTTTQTSGDCHTIRCNGAGAPVETQDDTDLPPDDNNQCTAEVCTDGVASHPSHPLGVSCTQDGGNKCDGTGACVECLTTADCGVATECLTYSCDAHVCTPHPTAEGTMLMTQTTGDCKRVQCSGLGEAVTVTDNNDMPADDGSGCSTPACQDGTAVLVPKPLGEFCNANSGIVCNGAGACVACNEPSDCGSTQCVVYSCSTAGQCTSSNAEQGTPAGSQVAGDCQELLCNGSGGTTSTPNVSDVPTQIQGDCQTKGCDMAGNITVTNDPSDVPTSIPPEYQCYYPVCQDGQLMPVPWPAHTACPLDATKVCNGVGSCVECIDASDCATSSACQVATCDAGVCSVSDAPAGLAPTQIAGDCQEIECDGLGHDAALVLDTDLPLDNLECTTDLCDAGVASNSPLQWGTICTQDGGTTCDGAGNCILIPSVVSTTPAAGATPVVGSDTTISVTFSGSMLVSSLTAQTVAGGCYGSIQVSFDGFASCIAFTSAAPTMTATDTVATLKPWRGLLVNRTYKIRVTTAARSAASSTPLSPPFTTATGFTTASPNLCDGSLVISQVYSVGNGAGATYNSDFVELHNRGSQDVSLSGWSLQYGSGTGTTWNSRYNFTAGATIGAGKYFLISLGTAGTGGALPAADGATTSFSLGASSGKVALVNSTTALSGACPTSASIVDFVGYGSSGNVPNCFEGASYAPAQSLTQSIQRAGAGCPDFNANSTDFALVADPVARNSATPANICNCAVLNESDVSGEIDLCRMGLVGITAPTGITTSVPSRVYETAVTPPTGASASVVAQLGYGSTTTNPQYDTAWKWWKASWNSGCTATTGSPGNPTVCGDNDEYKGSFTAPAPGNWSFSFRYSLDGSQSWTYCDYDGAGASADQSFDLDQIGWMTVNP